MLFWGLPLSPGVVWLPLSMPHMPAVPVWSGAGQLMPWDWTSSCPVSSQSLLAFLHPAPSLPAFCPQHSANFSRCIWGCQGPGESRGVLNSIWREFRREQGGGIVKQSEQIAYPS